MAESKCVLFYFQFERNDQNPFWTLNWASAGEMWLLNMAARVSVPEKPDPTHVLNALSGA
jgi:hypothetical protein